MSTTLAITAVLLWIAVAFEAETPGIVRRFTSIPFMLLALLFAWFFQLVSGCRILFDVEMRNGSSEPARILYEDSLL